MNKRRKITNKNRNNRNNRRKGVNKAELKPTMCSKCRYRFDKATETECYKRHGLRAGQEYVDCEPAFVHWDEKDLAPYLK